MRTRSLTLEASVAELSPGGDGVAICSVDGERRAVFMAGVLTGERVRVEVDLSHRPLRGRLLEVIEASPSRAVPPCSWVDRCGGCDWMHLTPSAQAVEHTRIVKRLLGETSSCAVSSHAAVREIGYRTRARVHVEMKRGRARVGMFARRSHEPAVVDTCVVLDPILDRARERLGAWLEGAKGRGEAQLALGRPGGQRLAVVDLRWKGDLPGAVFGRFDRAVADGVLAGARIFAGEVRIPATIGDTTPFVVGPDGEPLRLGPGGFAQATEGGNALLVRRIAELAREMPPGPAVELYAGAANLTVLLARDREITAVEQDAEACAAARDNLARRGLSPRIITADASAFPIPKNASLVVLDPPREGARAVAEALAERAKTSRAPSVIYVSCDPPTLARDVRTLTEAGYFIRNVETFEMFPHTSHVETVVVLTFPRPA